MTMENLLTPVILTIGIILAGTHTANAQCEFNHTIIHYTLGHWDSSGIGDILDVYIHVIFNLLSLLTTVINLIIVN